MNTGKRMEKLRKGINTMANKSGYIDLEDNDKETKLSNSVSVLE